MEAAPLTLSLYVQPGARKTEWVGLHDNAIKVRIQAPPVDGAANKALIAFLAREFGVPRKAVHIDAGLGSRFKRVHIQAPVHIPDAIRPLL